MKEEEMDVHDALRITNVTSGELSTLQNIQSLFGSNSSNFLQHKAMYLQHRETYLGESLVLLHCIDVARSVKIHLLLIAFEFRELEFAELLLSDTGNFTLPVVLGVCRALDGARRCRSLNQKISSIVAHPEVEEALSNKESHIGEKRRSRSSSTSGLNQSPSRRGHSRGRGHHRPTHPGSFGRRGGRGIGISTQPPPTDRIPRRVSRSVARVNQLRAELTVRQGEVVVGLTQHLCGNKMRLFHQWVRFVSIEELRHFIAEFGLDMWKQLADLIHVNPSSAQLPFFFSFAFDPKKTVLPADLAFYMKFKEAKASTPDAFLSDLIQHKTPYTLIRKVCTAKPSTWSEKTKHAIAQYTNISTLIWWLEELHCELVEKLVVKRLQQGEKLNYGYGKVMERLMTACKIKSQITMELIPHAENSLGSYSIPLKTPMAVLGDCSGSMQVAVRTSSIIVSLLAALGNATLYFFNSKCVRPPFVPRTIKEVLVCSEEIVADGSTSPAAALEPLYFTKKKVETLVVVTDEKENDPGPRSGLKFHQLVKKYRDEVSPNVFIVLVSFLSPSETGDMAAMLFATGIQFTQCRLNGARPDLSKLDQLLGKLSLDTVSHAIASRLIALVLRMDQKNFSAVADFSSSFASNRPESTAKLLCSIAHLQVTGEHLVDFLSILQSFAETMTHDEVYQKEVREILLEPPVDVVAWVCTWNAATFSRIAFACSTSTHYDASSYSIATAGTLTPLPHEVLLHVIGFLRRDEIDRANAVCQRMALVSHEAKFDSKFLEKKGEFDDQVDQIRSMGILQMFQEKDVLDTLQHTKGNVAHCIALLFGEGQGGRGRSRATKK